MEATIYPESDGNINSKILIVDRLDVLKSGRLDTPFKIHIELNDGKGEIMILLTVKEFNFIRKSMKILMNLNEE